MRRNSFLGQVVTAVARSTPATNPVRPVTTDTRTARPASQLLTAIARATPAFTPGGNQTLEPRLRVSRQPRPAASRPHAATDAGSAEDVLDFGRRIRSARQRRSYRQALVVAFAALAVPVIIASALIVKAALHPGPGGAPAPVGGVSLSVPPSVSPSASHRASPSALWGALILANKSSDAKGQLPPSTCKQDSPAQVTCTAPAPGISGVVFQTYPNQKALYAAYTAKVASLNSGQFRQNFNDCGAQFTYGEVGWNRLFQHTKKYTVGQMTMGMVRDGQAAGRVFCNFSQGLEYMVWTQNDGHLMGYVAGPVHNDVWDWWVAVHHNIGIGGAPTPTATATPSALVTTPGAPAGLTATAGNTQVRLSWAAPASDGGSSIASYKVYFATTPSVGQSTAIGTVKGTDVTVTGLANLRYSAPMDS